MLGWIDAHAHVRYDGIVVTRYPCICDHPYWASFTGSNSVTADCINATWCLRLVMKHINECNRTCAMRLHRCSECQGLWVPLLLSTAHYSTCHRRLSGDPLHSLTDSLSASSKSLISFHFLSGIPSPPDRGPWMLASTWDTTCSHAKLILTNGFQLRCIHYLQSWHLCLLDCIRCYYRLTIWMLSKKAVALRSTGTCLKRPTLITIPLPPCTK